MFHLSKFSAIAALSVATAFSGSGALLLAQDSGNEVAQAVDRVIDFRTGLTPLVPQGDQQPTPAKAPQADDGAPPQIKSEAIPTGSVPDVLRSAPPIPARLGAAIQSPGVQPDQKATPPAKRVISRSWVELNRGAGRTIGNSSEGLVTVSNSTPMITSLIEAPRYINLNQTATIRVKLENISRTTAGQVRLTTTLPKHVEFVRATPSPTRVDGQVLEFVLTNVASNQIRQVSIDLVPTSKAPLDIATQVAIQNVQQVEVGVREPVVKLDLQGPIEANIGQTLRYRVAVTNTGDGIAREIRIKPNYPSQVKPVKQEEIIIPALKPGETTVVELSAIARESGQSKVEVLANGIGFREQTIARQLAVHHPELDILAFGPEMNFVNREGVYSLRLNNTGRVDISDVTVRLHVPVGMEVTTISQQASVDSEQGLLVWKFDRIPANSEQMIQMKTLALAEGEQVFNISVRCAEAEAKEVRLATVVATRSEVAINVRNQSGPIRVGGEAQFLVTVENKGSSTAKNVTLNIELPEALQPVKQEGMTMEDFGNTVTFEKTSIEPGQIREFLFSAVGTAPGEHVVRSIVQTEGSKRRIMAEGSVFVYKVNEARVSESLSPVVPR